MKNIIKVVQNLFGRYDENEIDKQDYKIDLVFFDQYSVSKHTFQTRVAFRKVEKTEYMIADKNGEGMIYSSDENEIIQKIKELKRYGEKEFKKNHRK